MGGTSPPEKTKRRETMPATKVATKHIAKKRVTEKRMGMPGIRMKAQSLGLIPGKMKKPELIHTIQVAEGYTPCFGRSDGQCGNTDCCFIKDCLKVRL
jgi:hypothetical protein